MTETRFWLIRHALVDENSRAILYGVMDVPLCETTLEAQTPMYSALARRLPRPAVWKVTPLSRTHRTAQAIFGAGYPEQTPEIEADMIEQSLGEWQGLPHAELPSKLAIPQHPFWPLAGDEKVPVNNDCVDLTPLVREDMLIEFPQHPLCKRDCGGLKKNRAQTTGGKDQSESSAWAELDKLKL